MSPVFRLALLATAAGVVIAGCAATQSSRVVAQAQPPTRPLAQAFDGSSVDPFIGAAGTVVVIAVVGPECPIANATAPYLVEEAGVAEGLGFDRYLVYPFADLEAGAARAHAKEYGLDASMVPLLDRAQRVTKQLGVTITPEVVVVRRDGLGGGVVWYRGRINDLYAGIGRRRSMPTSHDLRDAINAASEGRPAPEPWGSAVGCIIEPMP